MCIQNSNEFHVYRNITIQCCLFYQTHFESILQCKKEEKQEDEEEEQILAEEHEILINHTNLQR